MKHLFDFVGKNERQVESLVEKLSHRFRGTKDVNQWRDLSVCLTYLNYGDKAIKKLQENFGCFSDKLVSEEIYLHFKTILKSCRMIIKEETKVLVDDFEKNIEEAHQSLIADQATVSKAAGAGKNAGNCLKNSSSLWVHTTSSNEKVVSKSDISSDEEGKYTVVYYLSSCIVSLTTEYHNSCKNI